MSLRTSNFDRHVVMVDSAVPKPHAAGHEYVLDAVWLTLTQPQSPRYSEVDLFT